MATSRTGTGGSHRCPSRRAYGNRLSRSRGGVFPPRARSRGPHAPPAPFQSSDNERNLCATEENKTMHINDLLKIAVERKASDLHLKVGAFTVIRVDETLVPLADMRRLMQEDTIAMAFSIMSARQKEKFKNNFEIDIAYSGPNLGGFRCNIFQQ